MNKSKEGQSASKPRPLFQSPALAQLLTRAELLALLKVKDRTLSKLLARGDVPPPAWGSGKTARWRADQFPQLLVNGGNFRTRL
jgi:hypothetical protein